MKKAIFILSFLLLIIAAGVFDYDQAQAKATNKTKIIDLPSGGGHFTRTLGIGPDNRLYVSIGSSCNVCNEQDSRRAKIFTLNKDGSDFKEFAWGLRNAVFFTWHPKTLKMWATEMGRDLLGDNIPPDEINIVENGKNYGWPITAPGTALNQPVIKLSGINLTRTEI